MRETFLKMIGEEQYALNIHRFEEKIREKVAEHLVGPLLDARVKSAGASNDPQWQRRVTSIMAADSVHPSAILRQIFPSNTNTSWRRAPYY
jgi:hypothetical protein